MIFREVVSPGSSQRCQDRIEAVGTLTQRLRATLSDNSIVVLHRCLGPGHTTPARFSSEPSHPRFLQRWLDVPAGRGNYFYLSASCIQVSLFHTEGPSGRDRSFHVTAGKIEAWVVYIHSLGPSLMKGARTSKWALSQIRVLHYPQVHTAPAWDHLRCLQANSPEQRDFLIGKSGSRTHLPSSTQKKIAL